MRVLYTAQFLPIFLMSRIFEKAKFPLYQGQAGLKIESTVRILFGVKVLYWETGGKSQHHVLASL